ncbi:MAG: DUF5309 domain-containing protein [Rhodospirillaceae bacterium]|nr:DUF5309 domain-containing protein [Rhodospirillaceae bacterium]
MALYTNAQNTYSQIGIKEDLADMVYRIDPEETPFQSNISTKGRAKNTLVEWQTQALAAPSANYQVEGDVTNAGTATARARLNNRCAISKKVYAVTGTSQSVEVAGVDNELDEQRLLKGIELKRDMEVTLLANTGYDAGSSSSARKCAGLPAYVTNADVSGMGTYSASLGTGSTAWNLASSTTRALSLTILNAAMKTAYVAGGKPKMLMLSPDQKVNFSQLALASNLSGGVQIRYNLNQVRPAALIGAVETWQSDFGALDVIVNVQQASDASFLNKTAFLIDPRFVDVAFLRPFQVEQLAKTGDADAEHVIAEYTLRVGAPKAHAILPQLA